jgi:DNA topoisomerase I
VRLRRSDCSSPGITRVKRGRGFTYRDAAGRAVTDESTLERIRELAIPPAWKDVWICADERGHLQAVGTDAAGRRQYRYHEQWRARRDREKFERMLEFARVLPKLRRRVARDLRGDDVSRERVLACAVRMLDVGFFRVGGESYAEENDSYGLATLRKSHATVQGDKVLFRYRAKSGQKQFHFITDPAVREVLDLLKRRRGGGEDLLAYREGRRWRDVQSGDINDYIKESTGEDFSAKDFRTWNATVLAAHFLGVEASRNGGPVTKTARKRQINAAVKWVAQLLGNTPAVCRSSYIDPRVWDRFQSGWTIGGSVERIIEEPFLGRPRIRAELEAAVVDLLEEPRESSAVEKLAA